MKEFVYQQLTAKGFTVTKKEAEKIAARVTYANSLKSRTLDHYLNEAPIALTYSPKECADS